MFLLLWGRWREAFVLAARAAPVTAVSGCVTGHKKPRCIDAVYEYTLSMQSGQVDFYSAKFMSLS
jgi:hypothetical protein